MEVLSSMRWEIMDKCKQNIDAFMKFVSSSDKS